jgi:hypothetical protein
MPRRASVLFALFCLCAALAPGSAASQPPAPRAVPGRGTRAPSFVTGIEAPVRRGPAAAAARAHLSANRGRYHVDEERLKTLEVIPGPHTVTVRFGQTYKGIEVFGAQYLVHMDRVDGGFSTESVNGHVFSDLDVDVTPRVLGRDARRLAVRRAPSIRVYRVEPHGQTVCRSGAGSPRLPLHAVGSKADRRPGSPKGIREHRDGSDGISGRRAVMARPTSGLAASGAG